MYVDYVARTKDDNKIFDLTSEEVAKREGVYKENDRYEPVLVAVGHNWMLSAVEEAIIGMRPGESKTIEVPPEKGAGLRDPKKVMTVPKVRLQKQGAKIQIGERVRVGNEEGVITLVMGRTVRVDLNSPLAGRTILFDVTIRDIVGNDQDKAKAIVKRRIPGLRDEMFSIAFTDDAMTVDLPKETRYIEGVHYAELGIARDLFQVLENVKRIKFVVTYQRPETHRPSEEEKSTEEKKPTETAATSE